VREAVGVLGRQPDLLHERRGALGDLLAVDAVQQQRGADDLRDPLAWVQRGERVLEDHLHVASQRPQVAAAGVRDVLAAERDAALGRLDQPHERARQRRLAAARLADEPERLALDELERDVVYRVDVAGRAVEQALADREVLLDVLGGQQRRVAVAAQAIAPSISRPI
jgi:hypothetical protein